MRQARSCSPRRLAGASAAALLAWAAGASVVCADPAPSTAQLRAIWEGGTWRADIAHGGGTFSGYKKGEFLDPTKMPANPVPLMEPEASKARAIRGDYAKGKASFAPYAQCHPAGMPYLLAFDGYGGYQAEVGKDEIVFLYGNRDWRHIWLAGRGHVHPAAGADPTYNGDSIAHWEGRTMVIDTTNIRGDDTEIEPYVPKPEGSHLVERYTPTGPDTQDAEFTMTNPRFTRPWVVKFHAVRDPKGRTSEYHCTDGNRWAPDAAGDLIMTGPDGKPLEKAED